MPLAHGPVPADPSMWFAHWPFEPVVWVSVAVAAWLYLRACRRVPAWPSNRRRYFLSGLAVMTIALASPLAAYESALLWIHMVQHMLLIFVVAPLLVLGAPLALAVRAASQSFRHRLTGVLHLSVIRALTHPLVSWLLLAVVVGVTHLSPVYNASLENEILHVGEHGLYLVAAVAFWWPVVGIDPGASRLSHPLRIVYLLLAMPQQAWLALSMYSAGSAWYDHYDTLARPWGPTPLEDQRAAAVIMWVGGDGLILVALMLAAVAWMKHDERTAAREDRRLGFSQ
jgi:cytochrome c oxidase assembly factor CtaG